MMRTRNGFPIKTIGLVELCCEVCLRAKLLCHISSADKRQIINKEKSINLCAEKWLGCGSGTHMEEHLASIIGRKQHCFKIAIFVDDGESTDVKAELAVIIECVAQTKTKEIKVSYTGLLVMVEEDKVADT